MAGVRPLCLQIPLEDLMRLRLLGERRVPRITAEELAAHVVLTWIDGPAQPELIRALAPRRRPGRPAVGPQQMEITEALPPPS